MWNHPPREREEPPHLPLRDCLAAATIAGILVVLTASSFFKAYPSLPHYQPDPNNLPTPTKQVQVLVTGCVEFPGSHWVEPGTALAEVFERAQPTAEADLRRYKKDTVIKRPRKIHIRPINTIKVFVDGAVDLPTTLELRKGTRLEEIIEKLHFTENADIDKLKRKRCLKDGESIWVKIKELS